jgi:outer membrane PBP1 activator LpoA protein
MSNFVLNKAAASAITAAVAAVEGASRKMASSIDALVSAGMRSTDFISPKSKDGLSTASPEQFDAINAAIVAGFTARSQKLLAAPTKALPEADKAEKRYLQQQIGARRNDFKRGLEKREGVADNRAPQQPKSPEEKIRAMIESIEKVVQGAEGLTFDAADFLKDLRALNRKIK